MDTQSILFITVFIILLQLYFFITVDAIIINIVPPTSASKSLYKLIHNINSSSLGIDMIRYPTNASYATNASYPTNASYLQNVKSLKMYREHVESNTWKLSDLFDAHTWMTVNGLHTKEPGIPFVLEWYANELYQKDGNVSGFLTGYIENFDRKKVDNKNPIIDNSKIVLKQIVIEPSLYTKNIFNDYQETSSAKTIQKDLIQTVEEMAKPYNRTISFTHLNPRAFIEMIYDKK